jgi:catechol 2,3-dioxygenase-like lactoylglutathione lyase family enzyme
MDIKRIHHVAYRCRDARETVDFYKNVLDMNFQLAIAEDTVPSTGQADPYMHVFMDAGQGNVLAFFELPNSPEMGRDDNTPDWVQHIAFELGSMEELLSAKDHIESFNIDVLGPVNHTLFQSIYFFDPNGHRIELATNTDEPGMLEELQRVAPAMIEEWSQTRKAPRHAAWMHNGEAFPGVGSDE